MLTWFNKQSVTLKVTIITVTISLLIGGIVAVTVAVATHHLTKHQAKAETTSFTLVPAAQYEPIPVDKMSKEQLERLGPTLRDLHYLTILHLPNTTSSPLVGVVVTMEAEGIAAVVDKQDAMAVSVFGGRLEIPLIPAHDERGVLVWHKEKLQEGDKVLVSVIGSGTREFPINYVDVQQVLQQRDAYRWVLIAFVIIFASGPAWKWLKRRGAATKTSRGSRKKQTYPPTQRPDGGAEESTETTGLAQVAAGTTRSEVVGENGGIHAGPATGS
jgi:hypothetical protein